MCYNKTIFSRNQDNKLIFQSNSSCCPSLFDEIIKAISKRRNIRIARRSIKRKNTFFLLVPSLFKRGLG